MQIEQLAPGVYQARFARWRQQNPLIASQYRRCRLQPGIRHSHFFGGRYENTYVPVDCVPALQAVLDFTRACVQHIHDQTTPLRLGFWFNQAGPGERTLPHSHDDYDEIMSAVYYVCVPEGAGQLVLQLESGPLTIVPQEGRLVLFAPEIVHEVTANSGSGERISIAMNIGPDTEASPG
jgi:hypothetical protein